MTALRTATTGILWSNRHDGYAKSFRLVFNERSQLEESPVVEHCSLAAADIYPATNAFKVFNCDNAAGVERLSNDPFRDDVIDVRLKSRLLPFDSAELSFRRTSSFLLKIATAVNECASNFLHLLSRVCLATAISGDVHDTEIDADDIRSRKWKWFGNNTCKVQKPLPATILQVATAPCVFEKFEVLRGTKKRKFKSPVGNFQADTLRSARFNVAANHRDGRIRPNARVGRLLESRCYLTNEGLDKISRKTCISTNDVIGDPVYIKPPRHFVLVGNRSDLFPGRSYRVDKMAQQSVFIRTHNES